MGFAQALGAKINGKYYDFSSIEVAINKGVYVNLKSIKYKHSLDPGKFRGTGAKVRGRTRGTYDADGGFEIYKEDYEKLKAELMLLGMGGYMVAVFDIVITYRDGPSNVPITDRLKGCRIVSEDNSHSEGNDALVVSVDLDIIEILTNEMSAVDITKPSQAL